MLALEGGEASGWDVREIGASQAGLRPGLSGRVAVAGGSGGW